MRTFSVVQLKEKQHCAMMPPTTRKRHSDRTVTHRSFRHASPHHWNQLNHIY